MKTTKQMEKEQVVIAFQASPELYYRMKFDAEAHGFSDMSKYIRSLFDNYFLKKVFGITGEEAE